MRLKDKVIIVTGAGQGIGGMFARGLAQEGANVVIAEINEEKGRKLAGEIIARGQEALAVRTDVSNADSTKKLAQAAMEKYGHIDVLINNAAIFSTIKRKPFEEITTEEWDNLMSVNLKGVFLCCKAVVPYMKAQKSGKIINISASAIFFGRPYYIHYITSKAGVIGFTRSLARELGDWNINVNAVTPGAVQTELQRDPAEVQAVIQQRCIKRSESPQDLLGTIIFLASSDSDFISGQTINVDGGSSMY